MSNRIVPATYRAIIDDVMANIRNDFAEFGVDEDVLAELQHKWEQKVVESNVAEFEPGPPQPPVIPPHQLHPAPPPPMQVGLSVPQPRLQQPYAAGSSSPAPPHPHYAVKPEPHETAFVLPSLPGPGPGPGMTGPHLMLPRVSVPPGFNMQNMQQMQAMQLHLFQQQQQQQQQQAAHQHQQNIKQQSAPTPGPTRLPQLDGPSMAPLSQSSRAASRSNGKSTRMPQVDGPSSTSDSSSSRSSESPPPETRGGNNANPVGSAATATRTAAAGVNPDEEINSDLDDDDSDVDEDDAAVANNADGGGPGDIVYCTYDKVQRVKNKWKCTLKDGIISVNGKDYLFSKCAGEFEW